MKWQVVAFHFVDRGKLGPYRRRQTGSQMGGGNDKQAASENERSSGHFSSKESNQAKVPDERRTSTGRTKEGNRD